MSGERTPRGPADPGRASRLVDAALSIMLTDGIQNLSHRAVAARAGVPLGSTTYYFQDREALLIAAIERLIEQTQRQFDEWSEGVGSASELPGKLADLVFVRLTRERDQATLAYELYGLAMRNPAFGDLSGRWMRVLADAISRHVDERTASTLAVVIDGLMIQGLVSSNPPSLQNIISALETVSEKANK